MKGFNWAGDLNGHKNPLVKKFYVADGTAIAKGEVVRFTAGTGIERLNSRSTFVEPIIGVSMQEKEASDGVTEIEISYSPTAIYKYSAKRPITIDSGSTTTAVVSDMATNDVEHLFIGGAIRIVSCAADSTLEGKIVGVTGFSQSDGTLTLGETLPNALAGSDTIRLVPGFIAEGYAKWDLDSDSMNPDLGSIGGSALRFINSNPETMESFWQFFKHQFGSTV